MDVQQSVSCRHPDGRSSRSGMVLAGRSRILPPFFRDGHPGQKSMPNWPQSPGRLWLRPARFVSPAAGAARSASSIFCWPLAACCRARLSVVVGLSFPSPAPSSNAISSLSPSLSLLPSSSSLDQFPSASALFSVFHLCTAGR